MKLLTLLVPFLITVPAFAQYKVNVCKLGNQSACSLVTPVGVPDFSAEFATSLLAEQWVAEQETVIGSEERTSWGQLERLKPTSECTEEELALATETIQADLNVDPIVPEMKRLPKTYSYVTLNVSAQRALEAGMALATKAMECGKSTQALVLVRNGPKGLTTSQVKTLVATYAPVKALLDTGSLASAIEEIQAVVADGVVVTEADKTALVAHINACKP